MKCSRLSLLTGLLLASSLIFSPAQAQLFGGNDGGGLVNIGTDNGLGISIGGGSDPIADVNIGGSSGLVDAHVGVGGSNGLVDANANVGGGRGLDANANVGDDRSLVDANVGLGGSNGLNANANVGGDRGLVDINVGLGGSGAPGIPGNPGTPGNPGAPGNPGNLGTPSNPGTPGNPNNPGVPGQSGRPIFGGGGGGGGGGGRPVTGGSAQVRTIASILENRAWLRFAQGNAVCLPASGVATICGSVSQGEIAQVNQLIQNYSGDIGNLHHAQALQDRADSSSAQIDRAIGLEMRRDGSLVLLVL